MQTSRANMVFVMGNTEMSNETRGLLNKALTGLMSFCLLVTISIAGFSLKQTFEAQLMLRELSVRVQANTMQINENTKMMYSNKSDFSAVRTLEVRMGAVEKNTEAIQADIKTLLGRK